MWPPIWRTWTPWWMAVFGVGRDDSNSPHERDRDGEPETRDQQLAMHVNDIDPESPACRAAAEADTTDADAAAALDWCPACGGDLDEPSVPEGYSRAHCLSCAQEIDRRSLDRNRGGGVRV